MINATVLTAASLMGQNGLTEALSTVLAITGFLSCVDPTMNFKIFAMTEVFSTLLTFVWFLTSTKLNLTSQAPTSSPAHTPHAYKVSFNWVPSDEL